MTVAVTGASGRLGRCVAELTLDRPVPSGVVLVTRHAERLADLGERGAGVRHGDFDEPRSLAAAFAGVQRLLLIPTDATGRRVVQHRAAIEAARDAGVRHVVCMSVVDPAEGNPMGVAREYRETERVVRESGLAWTFLRTSLFSEYQVGATGQAIATGKLVTNARDGRIGYVSREDCAAVAAAVLASDGHEGRVYDLTGPQLISQDDLAALAGELGGTPVRVVHLDDEAFVAGLVRTGLGRSLARGIASFGVAAREGWLDRLSTAVEDLTGHRPRSLRDVLVAHRAELAT